jgi:hypothetical protein
VLLASSASILESLWSFPSSGATAITGPFYSTFFFGVL